MPSWRDKGKGLTPDIFNRIKDRVQRELGGVPTDDLEAPSRPGGQPQMSPGLWGKILERAKNLIGGDKGSQSQSQGPSQKSKNPGSEKLDLPTLRNRIAQAGRLNVLALARYNGTWRHLEVMSYRVKNVKSKKKGGPSIKKTYLFAHCLLHDQTESFLLEKFEGFFLTDIKFSPRFPIEVA